MGAHQHVQVGIHQRDGGPAQYRAQTPDGDAAAEGKKKVFRTHGQQQGIANRPHTAFGRRQRRGGGTAQKQRGSRSGVDGTQSSLAAALAGKQHGGECRVVDRRGEIDGGEEQNQVKDAPLSL